MLTLSTGVCQNGVTVLFRSQLRIDAEDRTNQTNKQLAACREEMSEMESRMDEMKGLLAEATSQVQEFQQETESVKVSFLYCSF